MSLASYQTAPPRVSVALKRRNRLSRGPYYIGRISVRREAEVRIFVLRLPGGLRAAPLSRVSFGVLGRPTRRGSGFGARSLPAAGDQAVENAVDELRRLSRPVTLRQFERLVDDDLGRRLG